MRRVKFIWGASRVIRGRWRLGLFGYYDRVVGEREGGLAISVRGLLAWLALASAGVYLAGASALYGVWQRNPYSLLTWNDAVLYPVRRAEIRKKMGQALIAEGHELFRAQRWHEAATRLRSGLARSPRDLRARLALAEIHFRFQQRSEALRILQEGLGEEFPGRPYLERLFAVAVEREDYALIAALSARYRSRLDPTGQAVLRRWLLERQLGALLAGGLPEEVLAITARELGETAAESRVHALVALGRTAEAAAFLNEWRSRPGADLALVRRLRVSVARQAGAFDEMEAALAEMRRAQPGDPSPLVYGITQQAMAGRETEAGAALEDYLFRFGGTEAHVRLVAEPLVELGRVRLLQRCLEAARAHGYSTGPYTELLLRARLQDGDWEGAADWLAELPPPTGPDAPQVQIWRGWMQRLLQVVRAPTPAAQAALLQVLRERPWPVRIFRTSVEALQRAGRLAAAREVVELGRHLFPASRWMRERDAAIAAQLAAGHRN